MNFTDYALEVLEYLTIQHGENPSYNFANSIIETLAQLPDLVSYGLESLPAVAKIRDYASNLGLYINSNK